MNISEPFIRRPIATSLLMAALALVGIATYPRYRLFVLLVGVVMFVFLWFLINRTRLGALIRAGVDDAETVEAIGIDIKRVFVGTFMLGAALAGVGGALGGALGGDQFEPLARDQIRP